MNLFNELKRRHVFRVGIAYLVVAWLLMQIVGVVSPILALPLWFGRAALVLLGIGFPIALILAWAFEMTPEGVRRTEAADGAASPPAVSTGRKLDFVIIGALVMAVGFLVWRLYYAAPAQIAGQSTTATATSAIPTLAVLPFADMSPNKDQGYFADGTADELLNALAQIKDLRVTGRTSSFYFKGKNVELATIAKTLGVENILEGSVSKDGDKVRVIAQLINAKTGYHVWSETYDRKLTDIFAVQDDISKSVARALQITLGVGDFGQAGMTRNIQAYDEYLQARSMAYEQTLDASRQAISHAERAIALDPSFSRAEILLHDIYLGGVLFLAPAEVTDWRSKADEALARARALTPNAPFMLAIKMEEDSGRGLWLEADRLSQKLFAVSPQHALPVEADAAYGTFLEATGRAKEAVGYLEQARAINPLDGEISTALAQAYTASGNTTAALAEFDRSRALIGPRMVRNGYGFIAALGSGNRTEIEKWAILVTKDDSVSGPIQTALMQFLDNRAAAPAEIRRLAATDEVRQSTIATSILSNWAAFYGDPALALDFFKMPIAPPRGIDRTAETMWFPLYHDMRKLPGFKDLVRSFSLVDYWRQSGHWGDYCHPVGDNDFACD